MHENASARNSGQPVNAVSAQLVEVTHFSPFRAASPPLRSGQSFMSIDYRF